MNLKFKTISAVILSARNEKALYKGIDFKEVQNFKTITGNNEIQIIFPFYSYENRNFYTNSSFRLVEKYYIPASSLKGALLEKQNSNLNNDEKDFRRKILVKDIMILKKQIELKNLNKFQYLYQEEKEKQSEEVKNNFSYKTPVLTEFFPGVAIEMLKSGENFESHILLKISEEEFKNKLDEIFRKTEEKLEKYITEINDRIKKIKSWQREQEFKKAIKDLENIKKAIETEITRKKKMVFLGGYKGILASISPTDTNKEIRNGFYIDNDTHLPYGLVEVII